MNVAGIDVDSRSLKVVLRRAGRSTKVRSYDNDASGHLALQTALRTAQVERICLEATGSYHVDLAVMLSDTPGFEVMVLNPKAAKHFGEALMQRQKTDSIDAEVLAHYGDVMPFTAWKTPLREFVTLRHLTRRLTSLTKQRTQAKNHLHAASTSQMTPALVLEDIELTIRQLDQQIERLQNGALALVEQHPVLQEIFSLLVSTKGVGEKSALSAMGELMVMSEDMSAKQWVASAGLDPRHHQSGNSIEKKPRLSKAGNAYLRCALYMPALSASRHDPHVRAYYEHLINNRGLKKIQAVCAVMRKLLHAFHAMIKTRSAFDGSRFYTMPETAA